jgi:hypothetical protein
MDVARLQTSPPGHALLIIMLSAAAAAGYARGSGGQVVTEPLADPVVLSGDDVGFRVTGRRGDTAIGQFVVGLDGRWVTTAPGAIVTPVKK